MKTSKVLLNIAFSLLCVCFMAAGSACAQESGYRWGKSFVGSSQGGQPMDNIISTVMDSLGNTYIWGRFGYGARLDGSYICPMDSATGYSQGTIMGVFLAKVDSSGHVFWCKSANLQRPGN